LATNFSATALPAKAQLKRIVVGSAVISADDHLFELGEVAQIEIGNAGLNIFFVMLAIDGLCGCTDLTAINGGRADGFNRRGFCAENLTSVLASDTGVDCCEKTGVREKRSGSLRKYGTG